MADIYYIYTYILYIYIYIYILPIVLPIALPIVSPIELPIAYCAILLLRFFPFAEQKSTLPGKVDFF